MQSSTNHCARGKGLVPFCHYFLGCVALRLPQHLSLKIVSFEKCYLGDRSLMIHCIEAMEPI